MLNLVSSLVGPVTGLLDKFIEDKDQKNALAHEIATMAEQTWLKWKLIKQKHSTEACLLQVGDLLLAGFVLLHCYTILSLIQLYCLVLAGLE